MAKLALLGGQKVRVKEFAENAIIGEEERQRVNEVLESGMLSGFIASPGKCFLGGKQVREFEQLIRDYFTVKHAVTVNSATAGLHIALGACDVGPGDEVIVPPYTMSATATAVIMMNAIPIFADIEDETFCLDPEKVKEKITPRTKAIVVVHLFGHSAYMDEIMVLASEHNISVIEDCAQAPGATYKNRLVGTIGDVGVFSLNQHKTITCGEGGFAITNNDDFALRMQLIRNHGEVVAGKMHVEDINGLIGFNYRMTELEAAVSIGQFKRLDQLNDHRIKLAQYLNEKLAKFNGLSLPHPKPGCKHVYFCYSFKFAAQTFGISRDVFVRALEAEGIPFSAAYVRPIYLEPIYQKKIAYGDKGCPFSCAYYKGTVNYAKGDCPVCERMYEKELVLGAVCRYPHTKEDMDDVVAAIEKISANIAELEKAKI
ncbi:MAG: DegT/DnrJ/EryC1/StrS family aminotransferase [Candidatus Omnitrophota bacterium]